MTDEPHWQRRHNDPGFQGQLDQLKEEQRWMRRRADDQADVQRVQGLEQREQSIEQDAQARVQGAQGRLQLVQTRETAELSNWSGASFWLVATLALLLGLVAGVALDEYASYAGWWGRLCLFGIPCGM